MEHTTFPMTTSSARDLGAGPPAQRGRRWAATEIDWAPVPGLVGRRPRPHSTPRDYLRFQRMLLSSGTLDGAQILEHETVDAAFSTRSASLDFPEGIETATRARRPLPGRPGPEVRPRAAAELHDVPGMRAAGSGAWAGIFNTHFWVDPKTG